jgi:queuine tRNA-ribosyltransferase
MLFTRSGRMNIQREEYRRDPRPPEEGCDCPTCRHYSRGYLRHLYLAGEMLSGILNTLHNLHFYQCLMREVRAAIEAGRLEDLRRERAAAQAAPAPAEGAP